MANVKIDELKGKLQDEIDRLEGMEVEELTDADLDEVAGGDTCSYWCCSSQDTKGSEISK